MEQIAPWAKRLLAAAVLLGLSCCISRATPSEIHLDPFSTTERTWNTNSADDGEPSFTSLQEFTNAVRPRDSVLLTARETSGAYAAAYRVGGSYLVVHSWNRSSRRAGMAPPLAPWGVGLISYGSMFPAAGDLQMMIPQTPWGAHFIEQLGKVTKTTALYPLLILKVAPDFKGYISTGATSFLLDQTDFPELLVEWPGQGAAEAGLAEDVAKIESAKSDGATRLEGLRRLVHKAGWKLHETGSMTFVVGNPRLDAYQERAVAEVRRLTSPELIMLALKSEDREVRLWGTMGFGWPRREEWKDALPEFMVRAVLEPDSGLRAMVVERLHWFPEARPFLQEVIDSEKESSPWVWMRLDFNAQNIDSHATFNRRAQKWLASPDEAVRYEWLQWIGGQTNPSLAPMFRVLWRGPVEDRIREILAHPASEKEKEAAQWALKVFEKK